MENLKGPHDNIIKSVIEKEFIFKYLIDKNIPLTVMIKNNVSFEGFITHFDRFSITIKHSSNLPLSPFQKIQCYFYFRENRHLFETTIKSLIDSKVFIMKTPPMIFRNPKRKYKRVALSDLTNIQIFFKDTSISLNFPETENFTPFPTEKFEGKNLDTVDQLLKTFKQKMSIFSKNKIIMMRDKQPNTIEEFLIIKTGKSFYIPNATAYFPEKDVYDNSKIITKDDLIEYWKIMGLNSSDSIRQIDDFLKNKLQRDIFSELYFPVIYKKYVIAYIYLMNDMSKKSQISFNSVLKLDEFGKLLIATLIKYKYFEKLEEKAQKTELVDLSAGGLQFGTVDVEIIKNLNIGDSLKVSFAVKGQYFMMDAAIRRKYEFEGKWYFGVQFVNYSIDMINGLESLLYSNV